MQVYLSSARWSFQPEILQSLARNHHKIGIITNGTDMTEFVHTDK